MTHRNRALPRLPAAPSTIRKGASLKDLLGAAAVDCLARNIGLAHPRFDRTAFRRCALDGLEPLGIMERGPHLAKALRRFLPERFETAVNILLASLTPPLTRTEGNGLAVFFYYPHTCFIAEFGLDPRHNEGHDPFDVSMAAQYQLTKRFSAEFSIRPFLIHQQERTLERLLEWTSDPDPHVRRLCSEGTRPRLPWAPRIRAFIQDPTATFPILEALKDDPSQYVRRSVANHLGDIAKDHPGQAIAICQRWLRAASPEVKWLIRHALRHPAKQGHKQALRLRAAATG
jgi:3-methyladenine DNA glycosylase AlkC